jgi:peptide deformylase
MNSPTAHAQPDPQPRTGAAGNPSPIHRLSLVLYPDAILRTACEPVDRFDSTLREVAEEMLELMRHHLGIGLAAPQVGLRQRLIVCRIQEHPLVLTNLEVKNAAEPRDFVEGCLSLPGVQVNVRRPERIRVTGYDLRGRRQSFGATGLWARVIQHELDHLNGVLICDYQPHAGEKCSHCPLELPAVLVEERKHQSRPETPQRTHNPIAKRA